MDDTLDIDIMDIPILDSYWCEICHQDIPVDDRSPNGLMRYLWVWDLFKKVANYCHEQSERPYMKEHSDTTSTSFIC